MTDIKWQKPPALKNRRGKWAPILDALRQNPGEWALVHHGPAATAGNLKNGRLQGAPRGDFDAVARKTPDGKYDIYARFVGEAGERA